MYPDALVIMAPLLMVVVVVVARSFLVVVVSSFLGWHVSFLPFVTFENQWQCRLVVASHCYDYD
jgi:hypothetical protein